MRTRCSATSIQEARFQWGSLTFSCHPANLTIGGGLVPLFTLQILRPGCSLSIQMVARTSSYLGALGGGSLKSRFSSSGRFAFQSLTNRSSTNPVGLGAALKPSICPPKQKKFRNSGVRNLGLEMSLVDSQTLVLNCSTGLEKAETLATFPLIAVGQRERMPSRPWHS